MAKNRGKRAVSRRDFLKRWATGTCLGALSTTGVPAPAAQRAPGRIRITGVETFVVKVNVRGNWIFVRLHTDAGLSGVGEASQMGRDEDKVRRIHQFFEVLKGRSPFEVEAARQKWLPEIERGGAPVAAAACALEQAMWDIMGRALGLPVCSLLGGALNARLRLYANINRATQDRTPRGFANNARLAIQEGFTAIKAAPFDTPPGASGVPADARARVENGIACISALREAIGPKVDLLIDGHSHFTVESSLELARRVEPARLFWLEETVSSTRPEELARVTAALPVPTAGGEALHGVRAFYRYIKAGAVKIVMPDVKYCGGLLEGKKIAAIAEGAGLTVSPHNPSGPVATAASVQLCATLSNFLILEYAWGEVPWRAEVVTPPEQVENGFLPVPERPGFGMELNEKTIRAHSA